MEYVKIYDETEKYNKEIGEHVDPLLPNVSYVKEDDSVRFNLKPVRRAHFSVTDVVDNALLFEDVRGLKGIYINGSTENVCPSLKFAAPRTYEFELNENDLFYDVYYYYVASQNKLFTGRDISSYIIKTNEPISLDYRLDVAFGNGVSSIGTIEGPLMESGYNLNSLINEGLATQIDEYCVDISKFMENLTYNELDNLIVNLGCMLWDDINQTYITTINELYGEQKENEFVIEITEENVEDAFYGDASLSDVFATNLTYTFETELQSTDIVYLGDEQFTWEEWWVVFGGWMWIYEGNKLYSMGSYGTYIWPFIVYRDGVMLNYTITATLLNWGEPLPFYVQENGEYDVRFELKNRFRTDEIRFSSNLTKLSNQALYYCKNIFTDMFNNCYQLNEITIPNSVTTIGEFAFSDCSGLTEIIIPNSVTTIDYGAFWSCDSLTEVIIPNSVTSIGIQAFYKCTSLTELTSYAITAPTLGTSVFRYMPTNGVLKVPSGSDYSSWLSALPSGWVIEYI